MRIVDSIDDLGAFLMECSSGHRFEMNRIDLQKMQWTKNFIRHKIGDDYYNVEPICPDCGEGTAGPVRQIDICG